MRLEAFSTKDIEIIEKSTLYAGFFSMVKYQFKHRLFEGGWSDVVVRELMERGHAAAMLPYDPVRDEVVLVEQIRVGALEHASPWQIEIVAGIIEKGEQADEVVTREAQEEAGIAVSNVQKLVSYYPSAGGCSEKLDVFIGRVDASTAHGVHGLDSESEDIRVRVVPRSEAYQMVVDGQIENGASIIALQWLELNHQQIKLQWQS
ncbi:ADP-ribose diphosphatase [Vibrio agarivorans]|nr:ADP-ribose diphosphatase [Vibrio agarivorans]MDN3661568.1 ADP-ribose diphosphatase [Vibrio agarivorans]